MNTLQEALPIPERDSAVVMGRENYLSVLYRLIAAELYTLRRRRLSKVLLAVGVGLIIVFVLTTALSTWYTANRPASDFVPPFCSAQSHEAGCVTHVPTQADMEQYKQIQVHNIADNLSLPRSIGTIGGTLVASLLFMLILILAGSMVGGEYSLGTVRLLFTRGPTRLQFLVAKIVTVIICIVPVVLVLTLLGIFLGEVLYSILGFSTNWGFLTANWLGHTGLFLLAGMLGWFVWAMVAIFFGTLGRSTVAAIVAPFIWYITEQILNNLISGFVGSSSGPISDLVKAIPDYFVGNNIYALLQNQAHVVFGASASSLSDLHALSVLGVYIALFITLSRWLTVKRDVTN